MNEENLGIRSQDEEFHDDKNRENITETSLSNSQNLSLGRKLIAGALVFFGIFVLIIGIIQLKRGMNEPFKKYNSTENNSVYKNESDSLLEQKSKDSDSDGLSDYDELNIYKTSPYLEDTDSDGILDKDEIETNQDPNCPIGRDCYGGLADEEPVILESRVPAINISEVQDGINANVDNAVGYEQLLDGTANVKTIREMLISAGIDKKMVNNISDEDLMKSYRETLKD
ncbi:hypothetical protein KAI92_02075 [Candidatus Parcubacteria bacterium]|nr:hypothetical protein [Candidatus Parcubacteria bacterium]